MKRFGLSLVVMIMAGLLTSAAHGEGKKKIAVIPKGTSHVFWKTVEAGVRKAGAELGVEVIWKGPLKEDDRAEQIKVIEQFISEKVAVSYTHLTLPTKRIV